MLFSKSVKKSKSVDGILSSFHQTIQDLEELSTEMLEKANQQRVISINALSSEKDSLSESDKANTIAAKLHKLISE